MLIIVESPAKAKTIAKIVGNKYLVKASVGHIRSISNDKKTADGRKRATTATLQQQLQRL